MRARHTPLIVPRLHKHTDGLLLLLFLQILGGYEGSVERWSFCSLFLTFGTPAVPPVCCCLNDIFCYVEMKFFFFFFSSPQSLFEELAEMVVMCG